MNDINQQMWDSLEIEEILSFAQDPGTEEEDRQEARRQLEMRGYLPKEEFSMSDPKNAAGGVCTTSLYMTSLTLKGLVNCELEELIEPLWMQMKRLAKGESQEAELMLAANAITLNVLTNNLIRNASKSKTSEAVEASLDMALRSQDQMRKSLLALAQIRNPKQNTFVAQQNIANVQQVNNALVQEANIPDPENRLVSEATHEALDTRRTSEAITTDPRVKAMAELYRPEDERG